MVVFNSSKLYTYFVFLPGADGSRFDAVARWGYVRWSGCLSGVCRGGWVGGWVVGWIGNEADAGGVPR